MRIASFLLATMLLASGCALIVGIDDHTLGAGTTTATGGGGGTSTSSSSGGGMMSTCAPPDLGPTMCPGGLADCNGDGTCEASINADPKNCGACGHDCLGGTCVSGVCQQVALSNQYPTDDAFGPMTLSEERAYYVAGPHDANVIYSTSIVSKGSPTLVSATFPLGEVYDIAVDAKAGLVLATAFDKGMWGVYGMLATGGTPTLLQDLEDYTNGIAVAPDGTLFVAELHRIIYLDATDGSLHEIVSVPGDVIRGMVIDGQYVYWTSYPDGGTGKLGKISRATQLGKNVTVLADQLDQPEKLALDDTSVFWTDGAAGTISTVPKQGGTPQTLVTGQTKPKQIAASGEDLYWSADAGLYHIKRCALGNPVQLTNDSVGAISVDPKRVIMTDTHFHQVLGFAR